MNRLDETLLLSCVRYEELKPSFYDGLYVSVTIIFIAKLLAFILVLTKKLCSLTFHSVHSSTLCTQSKHVKFVQSSAHSATWQLVILEQLNRVGIRVTFRINVRERIGSRFVFRRYLRRLMYWISSNVCASAY